MVSVLLVPYLPVSTERLLDVLGVEDRSLAAARFGGRDVRTRAQALDGPAAAGGRHRAALSEAVNRGDECDGTAASGWGGAVIDSHTHLDSCEPPNAELVAEAERAGVTRMLTVGMDGASCRSALAAAEAFPQVYTAIGRHPNNATGFDDADLAELRALAAHERCVAIGETGLDFYRDYAPRADQERAFAAQIALAREVDKPLVIHTRATEEERSRSSRVKPTGSAS